VAYLWQSIVWHRLYLTFIMSTQPVVHRLKIVSVLKPLSSCNIACEAMVESLNRAGLEAYWLGLNLYNSCYFHSKFALETILEGVNFLGHTSCPYILQEHLHHPSSYKQLLWEGGYFLL